MKFRVNGLIAVVIAIGVGLATAASLTASLFSTMTNDVEARQFTLMRQIIETALNDAGGKALARAELIADLPAVKTLFAAQDRDGLMGELGPMFATQKGRHGVGQAQFHLMPAISFLRLNDPKNFGDDLSSFRPMVVATNKNVVPMKGVTIARKGPAIFGITPVFDLAGKHIGSFEIGLDFGPMIANLKTSYNTDFAVFIDEKPLRNFATGVDPERLGDENRVGRYIRFETTNSALMTELVKPDDIAALNEPRTYIRTVNGMTQGILLYPVNNVSGTHIGVIAAASDFSASRGAANQTLVWQIAISIITFVMLAGFVIVIIRGYIVRPLQILDKHYSSIASPEPMGSIEDAENFPQEMQGLVGLYEKIIARRAGAVNKQ